MVAYLLLLITGDFCLKEGSMIIPNNKTENVGTFTQELGNNERFGDSNSPDECVQVMQS